jgi:predicted PurR-regulated permease PerM
VTTPRENARSIILTGVTVALTGVVVLWVLFLARHVILVLYIAGLLAIGLSPTVRWIERRRITGTRRRRLPRWAAILLIYLAFLGTIAGVIALIVPPVIAQSRELSQHLPTYADELQQNLVRRGLIAHRYTWSELMRNMPSPGMAAVGVLGAVQGVLGAFGAIVTIIVLPFYLLLESQSLQNGFLKFFARHRRRQVERLTDSVTVKVSAWLGGQLLLSFIIGTTAALGLWAIGVPYFYVLALIAGFGELIPVVGPVLAAVPSILVALTVSGEVAILTGAYFAAQQFIENHFLVPRVMERQVGVSAVTVIVALLIGSELLGIVGALLAVPTAAIVQVLLSEYLSTRDAATQEKS